MPRAASKKTVQRDTFKVMTIKPIRILASVLIASRKARKWAQKTETLDLEELRERVNTT